MLNANKLRWFTVLPLLLASFAYSQENDSLLEHAYREYKNGASNDSTLSVLYGHGLISKEAYLARRNGDKSLDSARYENLRANLKHKFILDFLQRTQAAQSLLNREDFNRAKQFDNLFRISDVKPKGALESFNYYLPYDLYQVRSFDSEHKFYLLAASYPLYGLEKLFLLDDHERNHELLDTLDFNPLNNCELDFFQLNGHNMIRLHQSVHGTGYLDKEEALVGIIGKRFHNLFSTDLLQVNDWEMSPSDTSRDFDRWTGKIRYVDENGDGVLDIEKEVSEDVITMDGVRGSDFAAGRVIRHLRSWVEIYVWDNKTDTFVLDEKLSRTATNKGK